MILGLWVTMGGKNPYTMQMDGCPVSCGKLVDIYGHHHHLSPGLLLKLLSFPVCFHSSPLQSMLHKIPMNCHLDDVALSQATPLAPHCSGTKILASYHKQRSVPWSTSSPPRSLRLVLGAYSSHVLPSVCSSNMLCPFLPTTITCSPHRSCLPPPSKASCHLIICITPRHSSSHHPIAFS